MKPAGTTPRPRLARHSGLSRRLFLGAGACAGLALGSLALSRHIAPGAATANGLTFVTGENLVEPTVRASQDGSLATTLGARLGPTNVAGQTVSTLVYEESYPGPTLRVRPGDTLQVRMTNELAMDTNLHVHGMHVSPSGNADNVLLHVMPGDAFDYEYRIPDDHPAGLYWYHPHPHGGSAEQVNSGMAGAIIVAGGLDELPGIAGLTERLLVLQATGFGPDGVVLPPGQQSNDTVMFMINGQRQPAVHIRPGETQRWRILNATGDFYFNVALAGHLLHQIGKDGVPLGERWTRDQIVLAPGERADVLVQAAAAGSYDLRSLLYGTGFQSAPDILMGTVIVEGEPIDPAPLPTTLLPFDDLSQVEVDRRREITFTEAPGEHAEDPPHFMIDGQMFDPDRVDQTVTLGATEEWVITNMSEEYHPFHIHVNDYQVVAIDGEPVPARGHEDTTNVPPHGSITIRTRFLDFTGKYVYHCHLLFHEDNGMMGIVEVVE